MWASAGLGQFIYPDTGSINDFHDGDTVDVAYMNPFSSAYLLLYCE